MRRELPVRFWEGLGVQLPRATRLVIGFAREEDARRVLDVLPKRFGKYGLTLHPDKTRLVPFQRPPQKDTPATASERARPGSFDLLGFTHFWGRSRRGFWVVKRKTAQGRLSRALKTIAQWCRLNRHQPIPVQHQALSQKLRGHFAYFGITGNSFALSRFRAAVVRIWMKWLSRRRRRGFLSWAVFDRLLRRYPLPAAVALHSLCRPVGQAVT
jgi:RNA-directed DNA polymerase